MKQSDKSVAQLREEAAKLKIPLIGAERKAALLNAIAAKKRSNTMKRKAAPRRITAKKTTTRARKPVTKGKQSDKSVAQLREEAAKLRIPLIGVERKAALLNAIAAKKRSNTMKKNRKPAPKRKPTPIRKPAIRKPAPKRNPATKPVADQGWFGWLIPSPDVDFLASLGIKSRRDSRRWLMRNHPDKNPEIDYAFVAEVIATVDSVYP